MDKKQLIQMVKLALEVAEESTGKPIVEGEKMNHIAFNTYMILLSKLIPMQGHMTMHEPPENWKKEE